jgi:3-oxoacyl-[acyl-carrier-protein] synthase-3
MLSFFEFTGFGMYLPPDIETAEDLALKINKTASWIKNRAGVIERRVSKIDVDEMGAIAIDQAIGSKKKPDLIINASGVPKQVIPDTSIFFQKQLGFSGIPSFSVHATCLSFIVALNIASNFINSKQYKRIVIVSSDRGTCGRNFNEPESAALLGDAAAAVYIEPKKSKNGLLSYSMETYPEGSKFTEVRGGGTNLHPQNPNTTNADNLFSMDGPKVFKMALDKVYNKINQDLKQNNITKDEIKLVIPHQASGKGVKAYSKIGGFKNKQIMNIVSKTGNCVSASIPLALVLAFQKKIIDRDDLIYLVGTGAGLSIASALIKI